MKAVVPSNTDDCFDNLTVKQQQKLQAYKASIYKILDKINALEEENEYLLDITHSIMYNLEYIPDKED